ncbi:MAG: IS110 family transposase [Henriciella sp.]
MIVFAGLDISLEETHICIVNADGKTLKEVRVPTEPEPIALVLSHYGHKLKRVGFEASSLSPWLSNELTAKGFPAIIVEARHMAGALAAMRNKTDRNDARGLAQMMRTGWFRQVHVKSDESHRMRVLLGNRRLLKRKFLDVENAIRGTLKVFGVKLNRTTRGRFEEDLRALLADADPMLRALADSMLKARAALFEEFQKCHKLLLDIARNDEVCRRFMTVPGVGPVTALSYKSCIDDPARFRRSKTVGAHLGLTPKRYQSGSVDFNSRVSKCGDPETRWLLVEAANSMLSNVRSWSVLKAWGTGLQRRLGHRRACVALARKLAVILHRMWRDGSDFIASRDGLRARMG